MSVPWIGGSVDIDASRWWVDTIVAVETHYWLNADGEYDAAELLGWWDGVVTQPVEVLGYWEGTVRPFAPAP